MAKVLRPIGRYHGGKWRIAPWIISHMPPHRLYCEPFGGLGSVLLRKPPAQGEIFNDLDSNVVNLFRVLRDPVTAGELQRLVYLTPYAREEYDAAAVNLEPTAHPNIENARRYLVRLAMGFGSKGVAQARPNGFRVSVRKTHAAPSECWANWPAYVAAIAERLRGVVIEHRPAHQLMLACDSPTTLFYLDPPYLPSTRTALRPGRTGIYDHEMSVEDHRAMLEALGQLDGMVLLSGYRSDLYDEFLAEWQCHTRDVRADGGRRRVECLWINPAALSSGAALQAGQRIFAGLEALGL